MIRQYEHRLRGMTYILGSMCSDGVVLVGDRKITLGSGAAHEYEDKLFSDMFWMVVGSSGISGLFEKFRERLTNKLRPPEWDNMMPTLITIIEKITRELNQEYHDILEGQVFDVLIGAKTTINPVLKYIHPFGFAEGVRRYKVIGHGEPYGSFLLKHWWHENMPMLEVAELGFFIIKYIQEFELDNTVGIGDGYPQVWLIPNEPVPENATPEQRQALNPHPPSVDEMQALETRVSKRLTAFKQLPWRIS
jgi:20S proteasome alpha/beta subunit